jgi:spermidine/putrescine transport system substrate-binding protein
MTIRPLLLIVTALACSVSTEAIAARHLRILTWQDYVPADVAADFEKETGIHIEVTLSNNEDIIAKLRASGGKGFDLVQPSHDRVAGAEQTYHIYRPFDESRLPTQRYIPQIFDSVRRNTSINGRLYGAPFLYGIEGLAVDTNRAHVTDYTDLCRPDLAGKTAMRIRRNTLIAFSFASGKDPFALYDDPKAYAKLIGEVADHLIECKRNLGLVFDSQNQIVDAIKSGRIVAAMFWDAPVWELNRQVPSLRYIEPKSGSLGWIMTFALPLHGENEDAAYEWIQYTSRPEVAARITKAVGNFTAYSGTLKYINARLKNQLFLSLPRGFGAVHWYVNVPAGFEDMEAKALSRVREAH